MAIIIHGDCAQLMNNMIVLIIGHMKVAAAVVLRHNKLVHARGSPPPNCSIDGTVHIGGCLPGAYNDRPKVGQNGTVLLSTERVSTA